MNRCPTDESLHGILADALSTARQEAVADHVESCTACQERLAGMTVMPITEAWWRAVEEAYPSLAEEGLLRFDHDSAGWCWDLDRIFAKGYTENVADLMVSKLIRLPAETVLGHGPRRRRPRALARAASPPAGAARPASRPSCKRRRAGPAPQRRAQACLAGRECDQLCSVKVQASDLDRCEDAIVLVG